MPRMLKMVKLEEWQERMVGDGLIPPGVMPRRGFKSCAKLSRFGTASECAKDMCGMSEAILLTPDPIGPEVRAQKGPGGVSGIPVWALFSSGSITQQNQNARKLAEKPASCPKLSFGPNGRSPGGRRE